MEPRPTWFVAVLLGLWLTGCVGLVGPTSTTDDDGGAVADADADAGPEPDGGGVVEDGGVVLPEPAAPTVEITSGPAAFVASTSPQLEFVGGDSVVRYECQLDARPVEPCTSPKLYQGLGGGPHQFRVSAFNGRDVEVSDLHLWVIDPHPPQVEITSAPAATTPATNPGFEFRSTDQSGIAGFQCQLDGRGFQACQSPLSYSGLALGSHAFEVKACDGAGNWGTPATHGWQITLSPATYDQSFVSSSRTFTGVNGWFPQVSEDARYLLSGFGEIYGIDLTTGTSVHLMSRGYYPA